MSCEIKEVLRLVWYSSVLAKPSCLKERGRFMNVSQDVSIKIKDVSNSDIPTFTF